MTNSSVLTLTGIAYRCQQETERFWQQLVYDPTFCFDLFQRALSQPSLEQSKQAWTYIHQQYHRQVMLWVKRHQVFPQTGLEPDVLADLALEKMWLSFASATDKLAQFPLSDPERCLKSLLRFLQMCVHSVVMDTFSAEVREQETVDVTAATEVATPHTDPVVAEEFWHQITDRLRNDKERLVVDAAYVSGLKPRQIYALYPNIFSDVNEIHRIKENILARLRRDDSLKNYLRK